MSSAAKLRSASPRRDLQLAGVETERLRAAMGMFATGVTVITTRDWHARPFGTTANAVSSVSLRPPLVLACLREESETLAALLDLHDIADGGDHRVVVGHVTYLEQAGSADAEPLLVYAGAYRSLGAPPR